MDREFPFPLFNSRGGHKHTGRKSLHLSGANLPLNFLHKSKRKTIISLFQEYIFFLSPSSVHVVFGLVISGFEVIKKIEGLKTDSASRPYADVRVVDCGQLITKSANDGQCNVFLENPSYVHLQENGIIWQISLYLISLNIKCKNLYNFFNI